MAKKPRLRDLLDQVGTLRRDVTTVGGKFYPAGTPVRVLSVWRGRLTLGAVERTSGPGWHSHERYFSQIHPSYFVPAAVESPTQQREEPQ